MSEKERFLKTLHPSGVRAYLCIPRPHGWSPGVLTVLSAFSCNQRMLSYCKLYGVYACLCKNLVS